MENDIKSVTVSAETIQARVKELAAQIEKDYEGKDLLMVCVLNGAAIFYTDLLMEMDIPLKMNFIRISSYGSGTESSGTVRILYDLEADVSGKHVLIVEDIIDSGRTLKKLSALLLQRGASSVKSVCLLDKPERRAVEMTADYVGFTVPDEFLVGYGLDYDGIYRNLKYIGTLKPEVYEK
ncbi:MAG: hypoxanthine phosphoribosyltransferase [Christensenellaceae bacterium]|nr:hypoxanthine phosphoribosyltransferase [Christensenellaceae bacterium]